MATALASSADSGSFELTKRERHKRLRELYKQVPQIPCKGLCQNSCGPLACSDVEYDVIEGRAGKPLTTDEELTCTMLSKSGHCTVYGDRPMICRLWGAVPKMPCPHGCGATLMLSDEEGGALLIESLDVGGRRRIGI